MKKNKLWFRRKTYGWGWTPITWEGWLVTLLVVVIPILIRLTAKAFELEKTSQYFYTWASVPILFMALILICFRFGEKPKWQWGLKRTKLSHIDIMVSNYKESVRFYDMVLMSLGWEKLVSRIEQTTYTDGTLKIFIHAQNSSQVMVPRVVSFYAETREIVDDFYREVVIKNNLHSLNANGPVGNAHFYSVQFKAPDEVILEVMYSPFFCDKEFALNNLESNFDPYS
ncbi:MAG: hypothetical protein K2Q18_17450 [Bdellovibrionales bacterium]|nr:hypothetical protein [Bdellovibrionales bacterium]